ncbi:unnamed protein product [Sympodiomycopsis kandeliae]
MKFTLAYFLATLILLTLSVAASPLAVAHDAVQERGVAKDPIHQAVDYDERSTASVLPESEEASKRAIDPCDLCYTFGGEGCNYCKKKRNAGEERVVSLNSRLAENPWVEDAASKKRHLSGASQPRTD